MDRKEVFYEYMRVINSIYDKMQNYEKVPREYGTEDKLYTKEVHVLEIIGDNDSITATDIAKSMFVTIGAISQTIEKLVSKEMVVQEKHTADTRKKILRLTEKGRQIHVYHKEKDRVAYERYLSRLDEYSKDDLELSMKILMKVFKIGRDE